MNKTDRTLLWVLLWAVILTSGEPDLLDKFVELLDAWISSIGESSCAPSS
jgi:hypothetical protein